VAGSRPPIPCSRRPCTPRFWARNFDDFDTARRRFEDLLRAFREQGDEATASGVLTHLARLEVMTGRMDRARLLAALGVRSRTELAAKMPPQGTAAPQS